MIQLKSLKRKGLSNKDVLNICKLKNEYWKYGVSSNLKWFKKNIKKNDIHNLLFFNNELIGYTLLRKRIAFIKKKSIIKKINYFYFDTLVIKKIFRKKKYRKLIMRTNSKVIVKQKLHSFLICSKKSVKYYRKFKWNLISKKKFKLMDHQSSKNGMIFNNKYKLKNIKFLYYID